MTEYNGNGWRGTYPPSRLTASKEALARAIREKYNESPPSRYPTEDALAEHLLSSGVVSERSAPVVGVEALARWLYEKYRSWENLDVTWDEQGEHIREGRRQSAEALIESGLLVDRAVVERDAAAKALEEAAEDIRHRRLVIRSSGSARDDETWDNGNVTAEARVRARAAEYREGRRVLITHPHDGHDITRAVLSAALAAITQEGTR